MNMKYWINIVLFLFNTHVYAEDIILDSSDILFVQEDFQIEEVKQKKDKTLLDYQMLYNGLVLNYEKISNSKKTELEINIINNESACFLASKRNDITFIKICEEKQISFGDLNKNGEAIIHRLAAKSNDIDIFIKNKNFLNIKTNKGETPLHYYSYNNSAIKVGQYIIKNSQNINEKNNVLQTPLHYAVIGKNYNAIKLLLNQKADLWIKDINNKNAIDYMIESYSKEDFQKIFYYLPKNIQLSVMNKFS